MCPYWCGGLSHFLIIAFEPRRPTELADGRLLGFVVSGKLIRDRHRYHRLPFTAPASQTSGRVAHAARPAASCAAKAVSTAAVCTRSSQANPPPPFARGGKEGSPSHGSGSGFKTGTGPISWWGLSPFRNSFSALAGTGRERAAGEDFEFVRLRLLPTLVRRGGLGAGEVGAAWIGCEQALQHVPVACSNSDGEAVAASL